jgi:hypothetical protein
MRKQRKDSSRNRLTPEQQVMVESWLFRENLGYARTVKRIREEFGVEMSVPGVSRLYHYLDRMRQARELIEAHVRENPMEEMPSTDEQQRTVAMTLATKAIFHASCARSGATAELLPYLKLLLENERNDLRRRKLNLTERSLSGQPCRTATGKT